MVYEGPFVVKNMLDQLDRFRQRDNIKNWEDVRGLAKSINEANKIVQNGLNKNI
jgi:dihydroorotate dehydrogenase